MCTNSFTSLFLLGGYDLEMLTIRQMLEGRDGCTLLDKHLQWGNAQLSAYQEELSRLDGYANIYGIELQEDIPLPQKYHRIDHHNDWAGNPSSLEQVAVVMGVELTRYQQLVAANDKGYIPAMEALGASAEEIEDIRRKDREVQGVTDKDEFLAEKAIANCLRTHGDITLVQALSSHFSPICDRLYPYRNLLIYNDVEWMFCGVGTAELVRLLTDEIQQKKVYHGGGDNGYIESVQNAFDKTEIEQFVNKLIKKYEHI